MSKSPPLRRGRWPLVVSALLIACVAVGGLTARHVQRKREQQTATNKLYAEVKQDILQVLKEKMESLPDDDAIIKRYGRFQRLRVKGDVSRANYAWRLVERLCFGVVLEFENANAELGLGITCGPEPAITRLTMTPTDEWIAEHPTSFDGFVLTDINGLENNLCMRLKGGGMTVGMFDGWATHPLAP